jgi:hypothetical protein
VRKKISIIPIKYKTYVERFFDIIAKAKVNSPLTLREDRGVKWEVM